MRPAVINDRGVQSAVSGREARGGQQGMTLSWPASPAPAFRHMFHVLLTEGGLILCQIINSEKLITFIEITVQDYVMGLFQF